MRVCLGGTFHPFHVGHEALLAEACRGATALFVGITDGGLAGRPDRDVADWNDRAAVVEAFVRGQGFLGELTVSRLADAMGPAASEAYDAIVVSPETAPGAQAINAHRLAAGLPTLQVRTVPHVLADDLRPVSATRVASGDLDRDGHRRTPVRVAVGSANPVKVAGVRAACGRLLPGLDVDVRGFEVPSGVGEQPRHDETLRGARQRARAALAAWPEADYAVGVEAGLHQDPEGSGWYDAQACAVLDGDGLETDGWGPAFQYPDWVTERALDGEMVSDILGPVAQDPRIGGTTGAIGFLTDGRYDRTEFTVQAVLMAFVPRVRRDLYVMDPTRRP